jgi:hypothetical protein
MNFGSIPFVARATPVAPAAGLAIVQDAGRNAETYTSIPQQTITAPASGNALVVAVQSSTGSGTPTVSDSAGGTWGAALFSFDGVETNTSWHVFTRNNVTDAPTWVRATFGSDGFNTVGVLEVSGAGTGVVVDSSGGASSVSSSATWSYPFTSTVDDVLLLAFAGFTGGCTATGVAPLVSTSDVDSYSFYARGIFPASGSNTGSVTLSASQGGDKAWVALRAGA